MAAASALGGGKGICFQSTITMDRELFAPPLIFMVMQSETVKDTC